MSDTGRFRPQTFTSDDTFIVRPFKEETDNASTLKFRDDLPQYVVVELGSDDIVAYFYSDLEITNGANSLVGKYIMQFYGDTNELVVNQIWYAMFQKKSERGEATPYFGIGNCSKI